MEFSTSKAPMKCFTHCYVYNFHSGNTQILCGVFVCFLLTSCDYCYEHKNFLCDSVTQFNSLTSILRRYQMQHACEYHEFLNVKKKCVFESTNCGNYSCADFFFWFHNDKSWNKKLSNANLLSEI